MTMKSLFLFLTSALGIVLLCLAPELLSAQGAPPGFPGDPDQVPIDGGLGLLAAAGGAYALNKLRKSKAE